MITKFNNRNIFRKVLLTILTVLFAISLTACQSGFDSMEAIESEAEDFASTAIYDSEDPTKNETVKNYYMILAIVWDAETVFFDFDDTTYYEGDDIIPISEQYDLAEKAKEVTSQSADMISEVTFDNTSGQVLKSAATLYLNKLSVNCQLAMDYMNSDDDDLTAYEDSYSLLENYQTNYYGELDDYLYSYLSEEEYIEIFNASDYYYLGSRSENNETSGIELSEFNINDNFTHAVIIGVASLLLAFFAKRQKAKTNKLKEEFEESEF